MFIFISLSKIQSFALIAQLIPKLRSPVIAKSEHKMFVYVCKQETKNFKYLENAESYKHEILPKCFAY